MFAPLHTQRLVLRPFRAGDAPELARRRSQPAVAEYQNWIAPYSLESAREMATQIVAMQGPANNKWWMLTITDLDDAVIYGDLALRLAWEGRSAEIGYTLAQEHWGNGYATEAINALIEYLFETVGVTRVGATLHPDNVPSAMVLERTGFRYEGRTRLSFWVGDDNTDDLLYGLTREDWDAWRKRPRGAPSNVRLVEVTPDNSKQVRALTTHKSQERFVAPVLQSLAEALVPQLHEGNPVTPWFRAIEADGEIVGFVGLTMAPDRNQVPFVWRFLIDGRHQRRGIGRRALDLIVDECRHRGHTELDISWVPGRGSPQALYLAYGFEPTGNLIDGEIEGRLKLS